jgi:hypothetical protein
MAQRTTRFLGVALGASVSITALQAGQSASVGPVAWGVEPDLGPPPESSIHLTPGTGESGMAATAVIHWQPALNVAPQQLLLRGSVTGSGISEGASDAYDPQGQDLDWVWQIERVGDPAWQLSTYDAPVRGLANWYRKGVRYEKRTGMVFHEPGTYRIYVTCIRRSDGARATSAIIEHTVSAPDDVFTSAQTFVVSNDGVFTGAPANAGTYSSFQAAANAAISNGVSRARILFKRGTTGYGGSNFNDASAASLNDILLSTWGSGARPTFGGNNLVNVQNPSSGDRHWRVSEIDWVGTWNAATNTGTRHGGAAFLVVGISAVRAHFTISRCDCLNTGNGWIENTGAITVGHVAISDGVCFGFNVSPALYNCGQSFIAIGCRVEPRDDALAFITGQGGAFGFRLDNARWLLEVSQCDLFNRLANSFDGNRSVQPMIRFRSTGNDDAGSYSNINRVWLEGTLFSMRGGGGGGDPLTQITQNVRMCYILGAYSLLSGCIGTQGSGLQVQSCVLVAPPNSARSGPVIEFSFPSFVQCGNGGASVQAGSYANPVRVLSTTCINLRDGTSNAVLSVGGSVTGTQTVQNNLRHAPFLSSGAINDGAFVADALYALKYNGYYAEDRALIPPTVTPTHVVELSGATGTFNEGSSSGMTTTHVTLTAPGTVTARVAQRQTTGGVTRLWLFDVTGTIAQGATVTVSSGGSGTAVAAMQEARIMRAWQPLFAPGADAGQPFARIGITGELQTSAFRGAWPQAV